MLTIPLTSVAAYRKYRELPQYHKLFACAVATDLVASVGLMAIGSVGLLNLASISPALSSCALFGGGIYFTLTLCASSCGTCVHVRSWDREKQEEEKLEQYLLKLGFDKRAKPTKAELESAYRRRVSAGEDVDTAHDYLWHTLFQTPSPTAAGAPPANT